MTTHTATAWLSGDPRRLRPRHHREHVEGDSKTPQRGEVANTEIARVD